MKRLGEVLAGLPRLARWALGAAAGLVLIGLVVAGAWAFVEHREASAARAFALVAAEYQQAVAGTDAEATGRVAGTLKEFLKAHPRSRVTAQAWYMLGNVEFRRRAFDAAGAAFEESARASHGILAGLSRLGMGYAFEAKGDRARALDAYQAALRERDPRDFLYAELLLAVARNQEELKQPAAAVESYRRFLKDVPASPRADEVRGRLALLGAPAD